MCCREVEETAAEGEVELEEGQKEVDVVAVEGEEGAQRQHKRNNNSSITQSVARHITLLLPLLLPLPPNNTTNKMLFALAMPRPPDTDLLQNR